MTCDPCGAAGARIRRATRSFGRGRTALLIEGVPVVRCPVCRESYLVPAPLGTRHRRGVAAW
jgi:YgiT-type zinc finger domain-containing protein